MCMALSPNMCYLKRSVENPKDLWTSLDRTFGMIDNSTLESIYNTIIILDPKLSASTLSDEFFQAEEEAESSTQSIWIEDKLLAVTPSPDALEVYEIYDISYSHMDDKEEEIQISYIEEKLSFNSMQTLSSVPPLNFVQNLPVIASESEEIWFFFR